MFIMHNEGQLCKNELDMTESCGLNYPKVLMSTGIIFNSFATFITILSCFSTTVSHYCRYSPLNRIIWYFLCAYFAYFVLKMYGTVAPKLKTKKKEIIKVNITHFYMELHNNTVQITVTTIIKQS